MEESAQSQPAPAATHEPEIESGFSLFKPSVAGIVRNILTFIVLVVLPGVIATILLMAVGGIGAGVNQPYTTTSAEVTVGAGLVLTFLVIILISLVIAPALIHLQLESTRDKAVSVGDVLKVGLKFLLRYLGLSIAVGFIVVVGFILFIIPGIFMLKRYILAPYYMLDQNLGVFDAMRRSADDSKKLSNALWPLIFVLIFLFLLSVIPLVGFIGSILTLLYSFAPAVLYHRVRSAA